MNAPPKEIPSGNQATISRSLSEVIKEAALFKESGPPGNDIHDWIQEAQSIVERAKDLYAKGSKDDGFMDFAKAAVILRAKLPSLPGYAQLSMDRKNCVALIVYEAFSYINQYHADILSRISPRDKFSNSDIDESQSAGQEQKESCEDSAAWVHLKTMIGYEKGSEAENLPGFDRIPGHSYGKHLDDKDEIWSISSSEMPFLPPAYATVPPWDKNVESIPQEPRSTLDPRFVRDDCKSPISMLIPEIPPEPISHFLDLFPLEDAHLIPDFSPSKLEFALDEERVEPKIVKKSSLSKIIRKIIDKFP